MPEQCILDPARDCLGLEKARKLDSEIADLRRQNSDSHERIFNRLNELEKSEGVQMEQYKHILEKITELTVKVDSLATRISYIEAKPAKRWEGLTEKILGAVALAVVAYFLGRLGM